MSLKEQIEKYIPYDVQEEKDKEQMLKFINNYDDVLTRNNIFDHFSASAFVVNKERTNGHIKRGKYVSAHLNLDISKKIK